MAKVRLQVHDIPESRTALLAVESGWLFPEDFLFFKQACARLSESDQPRLVVDLRRMRIITSPFVSVILDTAARAHAQGQRVIVLCNRAVGLIFNMLAGELIEVRTDFAEEITA